MGANKQKPRFTSITHTNTCFPKPSPTPNYKLPTPPTKKHFKRLASKLYIHGIYKLHFSVVVVVV